MKQRSRITPFLAVLALAGLFLVGCGSSGSDSSSATTSGSKTTQSSDSSGGGGGGSTKTIDIKNFAFMPKTLKAKVGDTITFKNEDDVAHTGTSDDGAPSKFDTDDIKGGSSKDIKVDKAGTYKYHCSIHEYMKGTIEVS